MSRMSPWLNADNELRANAGHILRGLSSTYESSCNGDCNQGRNCDCAGDDPIAPARGIFNGLLLSIPIWGLIALAWWLA